MRQAIAEGLTLGVKAGVDLRWTQYSTQNSGQIMTFSAADTFTRADYQRSDGVSGSGRRSQASMILPFATVTGLAGSGLGAGPATTWPSLALNWLP